MDINGDNPPQYSARMYEEKSQWNKEVYQGYETSCSVAGELLSRGKTYSFGVRATSQRVTGKESDSEFIIVEPVFYNSSDDKTRFCYWSILIVLVSM